MYPELRKKMLKSGWSVMDLASFLRVSKWAIYRRLSGESRFTDLEKEKLSDYFNLSERELFKEV